MTDPGEIESWHGWAAIVFPIPCGIEQATEDSIDQQLLSKPKRSQARRTSASQLGRAPVDHNTYLSV